MTRPTTLTAAQSPPAAAPKDRGRAAPAAELLAVEVAVAAVPVEVLLSRVVVLVCVPEAASSTRTTAVPVKVVPELVNVLVTVEV